MNYTFVDLEYVVDIGKTVKKIVEKNALPTGYNLEKIDLFPVGYYDFVSENEEFAPDNPDGLRIIGKRLCYIYQYLLLQDTPARTLPEWTELLNCDPCGSLFLTARLIDMGLLETGAREEQTYYSDNLGIYNETTVSNTASPIQRSFPKKKFRSTSQKPQLAFFEIVDLLQAIGLLLQA